jgi:glycosyltransferase involved in cell wall biosynthesis
MFDNQSKDNTFEIAKDFESQYLDIVKAFQNPVNRGPAFSLNRCWEKSKHEYIFVLHSDNELIDGSLSLLIDYISSESYQQGIVFGDIEYIDSSDNVFGSWSGKHLGQGHLSNANLIKNYIDKDGSRFRPLQFLIDRKSMEKAGQWSEKYFLEDYDFTVRHLCITEFHRVDQQIVRFRDRPESHGHQPQIHADGQMDVIEEYAELLHNKSGINPKVFYTNTLCRIILMFIHKQSTSTALQKYFFYKKKYGNKISTLDVSIFSLVAYTKYKLKRFLGLS